MREFLILWVDISFRAFFLIEFSNSLCNIELVEVFIDGRIVTDSLTLNLGRIDPWGSFRILLDLFLLDLIIDETCGMLCEMSPKFIINVESSSLLIESKNLN